MGGVLNTNTDNLYIKKQTMAYQRILFFMMKCKRFPSIPSVFLLIGASRRTFSIRILLSSPAFRRRRKKSKVLSYNVMLLLNTAFDHRPPNLAAYLHIIILRRHESLPYSYHLSNRVTPTFQPNNTEGVVSSMLCFVIRHAEDGMRPTIMRRL